MKKLQSGRSELSEYADLRRVFESFPGGDLARITLLRDNVAAWVARWRLLGEPRRTLDVTYFILGDDAFGVSFLGRLLERAEAGTRVRLLLDGEGDRMSPNERGRRYLEALAAVPGIAIRIFRPVWRRRLDALFTLRLSAAYASEHDKIILVDGAKCLTGGRNVAREYFVDPAELERAMEDTDILLEGPATAAGVAAAFELQFGGERAHDVAARADRGALDEVRALTRSMGTWLAGAAGPPPSDLADEPRAWIEELRRWPSLRGALAHPPPEPEEAETRILDSRTRFGEPNDPITQAIVRLAGAAEREIRIQSPYFVLAEEGVRVLEEAGARGVAITLLTNSPVSSDNPISQAFFLEQWPEILARVPSLRLFVGGDRHTLHSKVGVFDNVLALVGTYNLDPTSMANNSELMAAVWSASFAERLWAKPAAMIAAGAPGVFEYRIARDASGAVCRDEAGRPIVACGPEQHCDPEALPELKRWRRALRVAARLGFSPLR